MKTTMSMLVVLLVFLSSCTLAPQPSNTDSETPTPQPNEAANAEPTEGQNFEAEAEVEADVETSSVAESIEPIEVTYFTPSQAEGPYYTVNKPTDRDNDLTQVTGATAAPLGEIIEFGGKLYDAAGLPIAGAVIEIWQTDHQGVYLHPDDPGTGRRDVNFQFYGEATTAADGSYTFRTILPGHYEPRPRHIHVKVKRDGQELLTTQFYFANDPALANERMFTREGSDAVHMVMDLTEGQDNTGNPIWIGRRDIVLQVTQEPK